MESAGAGFRRPKGFRGALVTAALVAATALLSPGPASADRYSEAGGCFTLTSASNGATAVGGTQLRFQASDLGSYLLYTTSRQYLAASGSTGPPVGPSAPAPGCAGGD